MKIKRIAGKYLTKLLGFERFTYYKALWKFRKLNISDKEEKDFFYFLSLLKEDSNILDIGANVGLMTTLLARKASSGTVFSFEPVPATFRVLERVVKHNKLRNVKLFNIAAGNENMIVKMNMPVFDNVVSDLCSYVMQDHYYFNNPNVVEVDVRQISIDTLDAINDFRINAVKIDVENYEYFALSGARQLLLEQRPIIYSEIWFGSENQKKVFSLMLELGYSILIYDGQNLVLFDSDKHNKLNYFFIPNEKVNSFIKD